ncbi:type II secretion system F family protein [Variovorax sp. UMC13]|uniref:type II secretion system F family protein n=1 Tax=Variovorax sp. UMC13 TaxID=1862326 RepID=UPI00160010FC|nr:type II secretion system F family protein [Variovorax sp. UMC13]MBB1598678.1 secretion system protein [Variovorax sp. UMC13]
MSNYFYYSILLPHGRTQSGVAAISAELTVSAVAWLEKRHDGIVLKIYRLPPWAARIALVLSRLFRSALKPVELASLLRDLAVMNGSGIPIIEAVRAIAEDEAGGPGKRIAHVCLQLQEDLNAGASLGTAFGRQPEVFPETVRSLARIGDETGKMDDMLMESARHIDRVISLKADAKQAMVYPIVSFLSIFGAGGFWVVYVLPKLVGLFKQMNAKLPPITVAVIQMSDWLNENWMLLLFGIFAAVASLVAIWKYSPAVRRRVFELLHRTPVVKVILSSSGLAFFSEYLSLLIRSGLDVVNSLTILQGALKSVYYRERVLAIQAFVERGDRISQAMRQVGGFPSMMVRMVAVGEDSGTLDRQLSYLADEYSNRLKRAVGMLAELIKPLIVILAGGVFLFLIIALLLPVYDLVKQTMAVAH